VSLRPLTSRNPLALKNFFQRSVEDGLDRLSEFETLCNALRESQRGNAQDLIRRAESPSELVEIMRLPLLALPIQEGEIAPFAPFALE
jgi:hypothetical protein